MVEVKLFTRSKICCKCSFDMHKNGENTIRCEICSTFLDQEDSMSDVVQENKKDGAIPKNLVFSWQSFQQILFKYKKNGLLFPFVGVIIILIYYTTNIVANSNSELKEQPKVEISGLASYGGDSTFAPLVAKGLNKYVESQYPNLELRYTKPVNNDFSSVNGIDMLLAGELSFAYNSRALTDDEYRKAQLRGFQIKQVPIAVDGIAVFSNFWTPTEKLNYQQVEKIFSGEINNWNQINPKYDSIPIVPIAVNNENYGSLNFKNSSKVVKLSTYTEVIQKVINTRGAISLASSSLVQNQRLLKVYSLASRNTSNYISIINNNKLNESAIKKGLYPLTRKLFLVYRQDKTNDLVIGEAIANFLISSQGQKIIYNSSYVPIY